MADIASRATFSFVRYAQCWEDADILLAALDPKPGGHYLSIASGGENSFSLLSRGAKVTAVDLSLPQLSVTDLKRAAYIALDYDTFLAFLGVRPMEDRIICYQRHLRPLVAPEHRAWLDMSLPLIAGGIIHGGKFENYFRILRERMLPLVHSQATIDALLSGHPDRRERARFYVYKWNNLRYQAMFKVFFSRKVMGALGRDAAFFEHVEGSVADRIATRVRTGVVEVNGPDNPYLHYILKGNYGDTLPHALRRENFEAIRANIGGLTLLESSIEDALARFDDTSFAGYNLSDIFEYMDEAQMAELYAALLTKAAPGARFVYWNMLAPRAADPSRFGTEVRSLYKMGDTLLRQDKAFFYSRLIIEEKR